MNHRVVVGAEQVLRPGHTGWSLKPARTAGILEHRDILVVESDGFATGRLEQGARRSNLLRATLKKLVFGKLPLVSGSFPYFGERVFFPKNSFMFELACKQGVYEKQNVDTLLTLARPDSYYFDVGANIGLMSIPVLWHVPTCRVVSVEPSPSTASLLGKTAASSSFRGRWSVVTEALGAAHGEGRLHVATAGMDAFDGLYDTERSGVPRLS